MQRLLIIEDDDDTRQLMGVQLRRAGYDVEIADSGPEALRIFLESWIGGKLFDAIILDCAMSPMDGFTVAKTIRLWEANNRKMPPIKIAAYTAYSNTVERSTLLQEVHADGYFRKPNDAVQLPKLVAEWLNSGAGRTANA